MKQLLLAALFVVQGAANPALPSFAEPGISPDGSTIAFVSGGDIWEVPARGGDARLLVSHPATESRPLFSPDGKRLAITSTRTGNGDVYVLMIATGEVSRLTFDDASELVSGWSADSQSVLFQSNSHEISGMLDVYRVSADGGTPMPVAADRYTTEYFAAPSPGGEAVAITARANAGSQWWRKGHSHLDESEIWIVKDTAYTQITKGGAKDAWPMWAAGGKGLYFMSDRSGAQNIWALPLGGAPKAVTTFRDGRVLWPTISSRGWNRVRIRPVRVRARLRDLDGRHGDGAGARGRDHAARRAGGGQRRTPHVQRSVAGARAFARRQEGGIRRSRRDLLRVRQGGR